MCYYLFEVVRLISNGIDLVEINRFKSISKNNKFLNDNFNDIELYYLKKCDYSLASIAGIYAAKEAFLKAIKKGISDYSLKDIIVSHNMNGAPYFIFQGKIKEDYNFSNISLSISHDGDYAIASVFIYFS